jgi:hypothetical protein
MIDPKSLWLRVSLSSSGGHQAFFRSLAYWHQTPPRGDAAWLTSLNDVTRPATLDREKEITEVANCHADMNLPWGSALHIYGDLSAQVTAADHSEVVIAGSVLSSGSIHGEGIVRIFVAGDFEGTVKSTGDVGIWVGSDLRGKVFTGYPSTRIQVAGDFSGAISPVRNASLLYLNVGGFISFELIEKIAEARYTQFTSVVGRSNKPAGLYPDAPIREALEKVKSYNRWTVLESVKGVS